jgi:hypothetical protein
MFTSKSGKWPHNHRVEVDGDGNGKTIDTSYGPVHTHEVKNYEVLPSELSDDDHEHTVDVDGSARWKAGDTPKYIDADKEDPKKKPKTIKDKLDDIKEASQSVKVEVEITSGQQPLSVPQK